MFSFYNVVNIKLFGRVIYFLMLVFYLLQYSLHLIQFPFSWTTDKGNNKTRTKNNIEKAVIFVERLENTFTL